MKFILYLISCLERRAYITESELKEMARQFEEKEKEISALNKEVVRLNEVIATSETTCNGMIKSLRLQLKELTVD